MNELLTEVYADPANDAPRAVYADHLCDQGHPLGDFIQLQLARAKTNKRVAAKEKRIFDPTWWPDHPVTAICGAVPYEDTHRGFPATFRPALPVSSEDRAAAVQSWAASIGHPGWATVREVRAFDVDSEVFGALLAGAPMPLLRTLGGAGPITLAAIAASDLPLEELEIYTSADAELPRLTGLSGLRTLDWSCSDRASYHWPTRPLGDALDCVTRLGVLERITTLVIGGHAVDAMLSESLALFDRLPHNVETLRVRVVDRGSAEIRRDGSAILQLTAHAVEEAADDIARLAPERVASLQVIFSKKGAYFTKRNRPPLQARMRAATAHLARCQLSLD